MSQTPPPSPRPAPLPWRAPLTRRDLPGRRAKSFRLAPSRDERAALAAALGLLALEDLRFEGEITPIGAQDYELEGWLEALAVQPCVRTLAPVRTKISEKLHRRYVTGAFWPEASEVEMPEDVDSEPLPEPLDLAEVAVEALMLALPLYPLAEGADTAATEETPEAPDEAPPTRRPFAGLADLLRGAKDPGPKAED